VPAASLPSLGPAGHLDLEVKNLGRAHLMTPWVDGLPQAAQFQLLLGGR
jgi:hypothetical protein